MAKCVRPGELADVKSGTAVPGKKRSRPRCLLEAVLPWTISNSSSPLMCKAVEVREMESCSIRGSVRLFGRDLCILCSQINSLPLSMLRRRCNSRKQRTGKMALKRHHCPYPLQHRSLKPHCPSQPLIPTFKIPTSLWIGCGCQGFCKVHQPLPQPVLSRLFQQGAVGSCC